jgi:zinc and cadmium transporter
METLLPILGLSFLSSIASLSGGVILLYTRFAHKASHFLTAFAAGALLATALIDLLPEALELAPDHAKLFSWTLVGILLFFVLERFIHWFHHHGLETEGHTEPSPTVALITLGDSLHNFIDGIVIAGTFMVDPRLGLLTTLAVAAHEIPQEIGDFGVLLDAGLTKAKIILLNIVSAFSSIVGAVVTYFMASALQPALPYFLALTAGLFIYIALADLVPEIHHESRSHFAAIETALLLSGVGIVALAAQLLAH